MAKNALSVSLALSAALLLAGCAGTGATQARLPHAESTENAKPPAPAQYLFGSAEADALSRQSFRMLTLYATAQTGREMQDSVVVAPVATPAALSWENCGTKPQAVVFDADETLIWNVGQARWAAEKAQPFDPKVWDEWERTGEGKVVPLPGAVDAVQELRKAGITVVINTNREARNAAQTIATLKTAGLGDFVHGSTLFLKGDDNSGSDKDARRTVIASKYCVIAMAGDQLGDFWNGFNVKSIDEAARRNLVQNPAFNGLWGKGWFLLPNPVYGPWERNSYDQTFPPQTRWEPKEGSK